MQDRIRILVVERDDLFRLGLRRLLAHQPEFDVVGDTASMEEAHRKIAELGPRVVILDAHPPDTTPAEFQRRVPQNAAACSVVVLTKSEVEADLACALQAGIPGYVLRKAAFRDIEPAVRQCARGYTFVSDELLMEFEADDVRQANETSVRGDFLRTTAFRIEDVLH